MDYVLALLFGVYTSVVFYFFLTVDGSGEQGFITSFFFMLVCMTWPLVLLWEFVRYVFRKGEEL